MTTGVEQPTPEPEHQSGNHPAGRALVLSEPLPSLDQRSAGAVIERDVARVPVLTQIVSGQDVVHGVTQRHLENGDVGQDRGSRVAIPQVQIEDVTTAPAAAR